CLVKLNSEPGKASAYLQDAIGGSLDIKSIPDDAWFWLGRSQQMEGKYTDAVKSYKVFAEKAGRKAARTYDVDGFIEECNQGTGKLAISKAVPAAEVIPAEVDKNKIQTSRPQAQVHQGLPAGNDKLLAEAMTYQVKADSLNRLAAAYRNELNSVPASQKPAARTLISETESLAASYQKLADEKFSQAGIQTSFRKDTVKNELKPSVPVNQAPKPVIPEATNRPTIQENKSEVSAVQDITQILVLFKVVKDPAIISRQKITIDPVLPAGLVYRIQIGVFSKPLISTFFKGIAPAYGFRLQNSQSVRYFVGIFRNIADASKSLLIVKQAGFKDSFITAVFDGKPVSLERAAIMEKEWGSRTLVEPTVSTSLSKESGPPTLMFRVEVERTVMPEDQAVIETYRNLASNRGFDILLTPDGSIAYIIGKFITFESASEYTGLLIRNGYHEARVVAYLGPKEIDVETARKLFEKAQ
ncbi:MAG: hypothetical protein Q8868_07805, partial [Bacteroidota bacterium]|nr:hypothetical protein [Bacteroidota bacterium]